MLGAFHEWNTVLHSPTWRQKGYLVSLQRHPNIRAEYFALKTRPEIIWMCRDSKQMGDAAHTN